VGTMGIRYVVDGLQYYLGAGKCSLAMVPNSSVVTSKASL